MSCKPMVMQGDQYYLPFKIKLDGEYIDVDNIELIEFVVGPLVKSFPEEVKYNSENEMFLFYLTEEETLKLSGFPEIQIRIKDNDGYVYGKKYGKIDIQYGLSKTIL